MRVRLRLLQLFSFHPHAVLWLLAGFMCWCARDARCQDNPATRAIHRADSYISAQTAHRLFSGTVLIGIDGRIAFEKGYGLANAEWNIPNGPATKFRIASLTKQFTGACILLLQERGQLDVQDKISKYVSGLPESWQSITLHQLLTHTSGIPNYAEMPRVEQELNRTGATPREMVELAATKPLEFKPGTQLHYSNTGYVLLGMVIERISGMSYREFLQKNIFTPLGMRNSGYDNQTMILSNRASGYMVGNAGLTNADFIDMSIPFAAGSVYSTVEDLYLWNEALASPGKLLTARSLDQMFAVYPETTAYGGQNYGYGVVITHRFGRLLYYHGGGVKGFDSSIQRYPAERSCSVVLENLDPSKPWYLSDHVASELFAKSE